MVLKLGTANEANPCRTNNARAAAAPRSELPASSTNFNDREMIDTEYWPPRGVASRAAATFFWRLRVASTPRAPHPVRVRHAPVAPEADGFPLGILRCVAATYRGWPTNP